MAQLIKNLLHMQKGAAEILSRPHEDRGMMADADTRAEEAETGASVELTGQLKVNSRFKEKT